jgi:hypothetical protein
MAAPVEVSRAAEDSEWHGVIHLSRGAAECAWGWVGVCELSVLAGMLGLPHSLWRCHEQQRTVSGASPHEVL